MKMQKFVLLTLSAVAMAMPLAASALTTTVLAPDGPGTFGSGLTGSYTIGDALNIGDSVYVSAQHATNGSYTYNTYFTVSGDSFLTAPKATVGNTGNASSSSVLTGSGISGGWNSGASQYQYYGLQAGVTYDWVTTANVNIKVNGTTYTSFGSNFTIGQVPEPEEWAMMLVGVALVGYQLKRKQRGMVRSALS